MEENKDLSEFEQSQDEMYLDEQNNIVKSFQPEEAIKKTNKSNFEFKTNSLLFHFLCVFGIVFLSVFFIFGVYLTPITVVGQSMYPTINAKTTSDSDRSHCDVVYYRAKKNYTYGDIVIFSNLEDHYINDSQKTSSIDYLIKRVIACPGDTITFQFTGMSDDNTLYYYDVFVTDKNGQTVDLDEESYIKEQMFLIRGYTYTGFYSQIIPNITNDDLELDNRKSSITISENCYFVMGDNRNNSSDSRSFGEISQSDICGNVRIQVNYGENIWIAIFKKITSYLSYNLKYLKENLWKNF